MTDAQVGIERLRKPLRTRDIRPIMLGLHFIHAIDEFVDLWRLTPVIRESGLIPDKTAHDLSWMVGTLLGAAVKSGYVDNLDPAARGYYVVGNEHLAGLLQDVNNDLLDAAVSSGRFGDEDPEGVAYYAAVNTYYGAYPTRRMRVFPGAEEVAHSQLFAEYLGRTGLLHAHQISAPFGQ